MKKITYIFLKFAWYLLISVIATTYKQTFGLLFLVPCVIILMSGDKLISRLFMK